MKPAKQGPCVPVYSRLTSVVEQGAVSWLVLTGQDGKGDYLYKWFRREAKARRWLRRALKFGLGGESVLCN